MKKFIYGMGSLLAAVVLTVAVVGSQPFIPFFDYVHAMFTFKGTAANIPATCTEGFTYWATDTDVGYVCSATDTWTIFTAGDVASVGDCTSGACYDGTSDGGTYVYLYDGSTYDKITASAARVFTFASSATNSENMTLTLGNNDNTVTLASGTGAVVNISGNAATATALAANPDPCGANSFVTDIAASGALTCATPALGTDTSGNYVASATATGGLTMTGTEGGSLGITPCTGNENYIQKWNAATGWTCQADADTGGATALDDIGDPDAATSISMGDNEGITLESAEDTGTVLLIKNTDADLAGVTSLLDLSYNDDGSANGYFIRGYDNAYTDLKFSIGADGAAGFGAVTAASLTVSPSATPTITISDSDAPGADEEIAKIVGGYVDGADGAENGTLDFYVHVAGSTTSYIQLDGKNTDIELNADVLVNTTKKIQFGDSGTYVNQSTDGTLNIVADTIAQVMAPNIKLGIDAAAYLNIATADGGATTISQVSDGADGILIGDDVDDTVKVRLQGACQGCPGATMTMKMGIERILKERVPEVKKVVAVP